MINKIIDGICIAINTEFGDEFEIYTESVEQGFDEPCFSILCLKPAIDQFLGKRYFRTSQFCIHYFPHTNEPKAECYSVKERLFNALELITVDGDLIRGTEIHSEIKDDVLSFFVNYNFFVDKVTEAHEAMMEVDFKTDVKEG